MISESYHWKAPLLRSATWLERLRVVEATSEKSLVRVERELFIGFYTIRKLLETFTVSASTRKKEFSLSCFSSIKMVDYLNIHRIDELFDLDSSSTEVRDIEFLCNQFIHSYVFPTVLHESGSLFGVYVSSDRARKEKLFLIELSQILDAFRTVGRDYPVRQHMRRNERTLQWEEVAE